MARSERAWVHTALQTAQKDIGYFTCADARNWLIGLRKISILGRTGKSLDTVHRVENAGHYLLVKRYIAEMQRLLVH